MIGHCGQCTRSRYGYHGSIPREEHANDTRNVVAHVEQAPLRDTLQGPRCTYANGGGRVPPWGSVGSGVKAGGARAVGAVTGRGENPPSGLFNVAHPGVLRHKYPRGIHGNSLGVVQCNTSEIIGGASALYKGH